jgi:hypothetical protein
MNPRSAKFSAQFPLPLEKIANTVGQSIAAGGKRFQPGDTSQS